MTAVCVEGIGCRATLHEPTCPWRPAGPSMHWPTIDASRAIDYTTAAASLDEVARMAAEVYQGPQRRRLVEVRAREAGIVRRRFGVVDDRVARDADPWRAPMPMHWLTGVPVIVDGDVPPGKVRAVWSDGAEEDL